MKFRLFFVVVVAAAVAGYVQPVTGNAQELSFGMGGSLYMQNDHLDDGGGFEGMVNFKLDRLPLVLRLSANTIWTQVIPRQLGAGMSSFETMNQTWEVKGYCVEPSLLYRYELNQALQPYIGVGYGFQDISTDIHNPDSATSITDRVKSVNAPVFLCGLNINMTTRLSLHFGFRFATYRPDVERILTHHSGALAGTIETFTDGIKLKTTYIDLNVRYHLFTGSKRKKPFGGY